MTIISKIWTLLSWTFIETNSEIQLQIIIAKIISILFKSMIKFHEQNKFIANLNSFFFCEGKASYIKFLKPQNSNKELAKNIFMNLEKKVRNIIKKDIEYYDKMPEYLIENLKSIERRYLIEKKNEKNSNEENKLDNVINIFIEKK